MGMDRGPAPQRLLRADREPSRLRVRRALAINPNIAVTPAEGWRSSASPTSTSRTTACRTVASLRSSAPRQAIRRPLTGHRDTFFGVPGINDTGLEANIVRAASTCGLTPQPDLVDLPRCYGGYGQFYSNVFPNSARAAVQTTRSSSMAAAGDTDRGPRWSRAASCWRPRSRDRRQHQYLFGIENTCTQVDTANSRFVAPAAPRRAHQC